jgi:hypothetical protein
MAREFVNLWNCVLCLLILGLVRRQNSLVCMLFVTTSEAAHTLMLAPVAAAGVFAMKSTTSPSTSYPLVEVLRSKTDVTRGLIAGFKRSLLHIHVYTRYLCIAPCTSRKTSPPKPRIHPVVQLLVNELRHTNETQNPARHKKSIIEQQIGHDGG